MSATNPPNLDEMIFAISQINYNTTCRQSSPPPRSTDRLSALLDNATGLSATNISTNADTGTTAIDDDANDYEDDSENDEDEENQSMAVRAELDSSRWPRSKKSQRLILLDLLALLFVTDAKSDVAATMLTMNGSIKFFYCKNRPFKDDEKDYVRKLFDYACKTDENNIDRYKHLMAVVVKQCQEKIKARILKVARRVKDLHSTADRGVGSEICLSPKVVNRLRKWLKVPDERSLKDSIIAWCDILNSRQLFKDPDFLKSAVTGAHAIGFSSEMNLMIDQKLLRRIRKLGDYLGAVIQLVGEINRLPSQTLRALVIEEVPTPDPEKIVIEKTSVEIINQWARYRDDREITETELRTQFPSLPEILSQRNTVTRSVHCECTLVMKAVNDLVGRVTGHSVTVEVGMSKSSCNLCEVFMGLIKKRYPNVTIMLSTHHRKNVAAWKIPPLTPKEIGWEVKRHIKASLEAIRCRALRERRSDSEPEVFDSESEYLHKEVDDAADLMFNPPISAAL